MREIHTLEQAKEMLKEAMFVADEQVRGQSLIGQVKYLIDQKAFPITLADGEQIEAGIAPSTGSRLTVSVGDLTVFACEISELMKGRYQILEFHAGQWLAAVDDRHAEVSREAREREQEAEMRQTLEAIERLMPIAELSGVD